MIKEYWTGEIGPIPNRDADSFISLDFDKTVQDAYLKMMKKRPNYFKSKIVILSGKRYWNCIIGSDYRKNIPDGGDFPLRMALKEKFYELFNENVSVSSGWGNDKNGKSIGFEKIYGK